MALFGRSGSSNTGRAVELCRLCAAALFLLAGCTKASRETGRFIPTVVTGDIQAGIEKHIVDSSAAGGGYFRVRFSGRELALKLVRVHLEYLAQLDPHTFFACVDMVGTDGEFYDVDFFMKGEPGAMSVTETTIHKLNGQPIYLWKQKPDKTWGRFPVDDASQQLLGVLTGRDAFEFTYKATVPKVQGRGRMWIPLAESDGFQDVAVKSMEVPGKRTVLRDGRYSNQVLYLELGPEDSGRGVEIVYDVQRREKAGYPDDPGDAARYLQPENMVPAMEKFSAIAQSAVAGKTGDLVRARALYDAVLDQMKYQKYGEGWGKGDAVHACDVKTGNCTDYHAYFIALCRAAGIPARFAIGAAVPSERDEGGVDGYHCWAEFYADGKWWPVDASEADKFCSLSAYYFGHHPANRFELSRGRDLVVEPAPASGAINFLAYPVFEDDGKPAKVQTAFSFMRKPR